MNSGMSARAEDLYAPRTAAAALFPLLLFATLAGCPPPPPGDGGGTDAATDGPPSRSGTYVYLISRLTIDPDNGPGSPHTGFNLDGLYSDQADADGCNQQDY